MLRSASLAFTELNGKRANSQNILRSTSALNTQKIKSDMSLFQNSMLLWGYDD